MGLTAEMSEGESRQALDAAQEAKPDSGAAAPAGQGVASVSPPVSTVTQPPPTAATEDEEEESEDESEILEESPCGRWQKRREEASVTKLMFYTKFGRLPFGNVNGKEQEVLMWLTTNVSSKKHHMKELAGKSMHRSDILQHILTNGFLS